LQLSILHFSRSSDHLTRRYVYQTRSSEVDAFGAPERLLDCRCSFEEERRQQLDGGYDNELQNRKDPSLIDKVKPSDQISATVNDGDYVLHNVSSLRQEVRLYAHEEARHIRTPGRQAEFPGCESFAIIAAAICRWPPASTSTQPRGKPQPTNCPVQTENLPHGKT
jgi:hypothetical protein